MGAGPDMKLLFQEVSPFSSAMDAILQAEMAGRNVELNQLLIPYQRIVVYLDQLAALLNVTLPGPLQQRLNEAIEEGCSKKRELLLQAGRDIRWIKRQNPNYIHAGWAAVFAGDPWD